MSEYKTIKIASEPQLASFGIYINEVTQCYYNCFMRHTFGGLLLTREQMAEEIVKAGLAKNTRTVLAILDKEAKQGRWWTYIIGTKKHNKGQNLVSPKAPFNIVDTDFVQYFTDPVILQPTISWSKKREKLVEAVLSYFDSNPISQETLRLLCKVSPRTLRKYINRSDNISSGHNIALIETDTSSERKQWVYEIGKYYGFFVRDNNLYRRVANTYTTSNEIITRKSTTYAHNKDLEIRRIREQKEKYIVNYSEGCLDERSSHRVGRVESYYSPSDDFRPTDNVYKLGIDMPDSKMRKRSINMGLAYHKPIPEEHSMLAESIEVDKANHNKLAGKAKHELQVLLYEHNFHAKGLSDYIVDHKNDEPLPAYYDIRSEYWEHPRYREWCRKYADRILDHDDAYNSNLRTTTKFSAVYNKPLESILPSYRKL